MRTLLNYFTFLITSNVLLNLTLGHVGKLIDALGEWHLALGEELVELLDGSNIFVEDQLTKVGPGSAVLVIELEILLIVFKIWFIIGP